MIEIKIGDCRDVLKTLDSESIDCVVTSPPYWGLRDYGTEPLIWDASEDCEHEWGLTAGTKKFDKQRDTASDGTFADTRRTQEYKGQYSELDFGDFCSKCGAWKGQLGLEPTPELYIKHLCDIFNEIKRALKKTGTCWIVLGDTYSGSGKGIGSDHGKAVFDDESVGPKMGADVPPKSLVQIPSRFSIEMVNRGWILRNEIIWHKPNCMPDSTKDRFTVDFEKIFFFVKNQKYWFQQQFDEAVSNWTEAGGSLLNKTGWCTKAGRNDDSRKSGTKADPSKRNKRTVWTIPTQPYPEAHFAVFPTSLIETPIKAGCPKNGWVLDPFGGSGTVGEFCRKNGYNAILIELNPDYEPLIIDRTMNKIPQLETFVNEM